MAQGRKIETEYQDFPTCPKCGTQNFDWWDGAPTHASDGSEWTADCINCEVPYKVEMHVSYNFTTKLAGEGSANEG